MQHHYVLLWGPLAQLVERRASGREIRGSGLSRVGGGFHMYSWSRRCSAYVVLKLKGEYHAYTNKNICAWKRWNAKKNKKEENYVLLLLWNLHLVDKVSPSVTATVQRNGSPTDASASSASATHDVMQASHAPTNTLFWLICPIYNGKCMPDLSNVQVMNNK